MISAFDRLGTTGIQLHHERYGTQRTRCPECDRDSRDTALSITIKGDSSAVWQCFRCGFKGATRGRVEHGTRAQTLRVDATRHTTLADRWRDFWRTCSPISADSLAGRYLRHRGCVLSPIDGDLRWHPECWHWPTRQRLPALVALITDIQTNVPLSLHFTFIRADGTGKADIEPPKLLLPRHRKSGGVIRLWPDACVTYSIGLAEGIESALSLAHAHAPVWATIDAGNLSTLPILHGIESVIVAVDHDNSGLKAAQSFATSWARAGVDVWLVIPDVAGADLNDVARSAA